MLDLLLLVLAALVPCAIAFAGGWSLRGLRDKFRAEVQRAAEWDEKHG